MCVTLYFILCISSTAELYLIFYNTDLMANVQNRNNLHINYTSVFWPKLSFVVYIDLSKCPVWRNQNVPII